MKTIPLVLTAIGFAMPAHAGWPQVISGKCAFEATGEPIPLRALTPAESYGVFAEGFSAEHDRIYLAENVPLGPNTVPAFSINFQMRETSTYSIIAYEKDGPTYVSTGVELPTRGWVSCDLVVR